VFPQCCPIGPRGFIGELDRLFISNRVPVCRPILVADAVDQIERLTYCLANSTKEHLVTRPERWPGAHAAKALCGSMTDRGMWINRTKLDALKRRAGSDEKRCLRDCTEHVTLRLSKLPCFAHLTDFEYQTQMKAMCRDISDEAAHDRRKNGLSLLGVKRLLRYSPQHVPERMDKTPAPKVHSCCPDFRIQFKAAYRDFVDGYREALQALNRGLLAPLFTQGGLATGVQLRSRLRLDFIPILNSRTPKAYGPPLSES
jgi:hypothetical protein